MCERCEEKLAALDVVETDFTTRLNAFIEVLFAEQPVMGQPAVAGALASVLGKVLGHAPANIRKEVIDGVIQDIFAALNKTLPQGERVVTNVRHISLDMSDPTNPLTVRPPQLH